MKTFLTSISSILVVLLVVQLSAVTVADKDWADLQTSYTQYKNNYNRVLSKYSEVTNNFAQEISYKDRIHTSDTNYISYLEMLNSKKDREIKVAKVENGILVAILVVVEAVVLFAIGKGVSK